MEDSRIVQLYWDRDQEAIPATSEKYGSYCGSIARNILGSREDAEECVNDTWLRAWNAMPPHRPSLLSAFLGKITRNLAFDRFSYLRAESGAAASCPPFWRSWGSVSPTPTIWNRPWMSGSWHGPSTTSWPPCRRPSGMSSSAGTGTQNPSPPSAGATACGMAPYP